MESNSAQSRTGRAVNISVVVPVYNEVDSIEPLHSEITSLLSGMGERYEIVFVDDGSTDGTDRLLHSLVRDNVNIRAFRLTRNQGKSAAYMLGFTQARGSVLVTLDGDLQDDPSNIPSLLEALNSGLDLVVGWKQQRLQNEPSKAVPSKLFNRMLSMMFGVSLHDSNSGLRAMRSEVATAMELYGDYYRFIPQIAHHLGFSVGERPVRHRKRQFGESKYSWPRFITGLLDAIALRFLISFREKPLHAFGIMAAPFFISGISLESYVLLRKLTGDAFLHHIAPLTIGVLCLMMGMEIFCVGLVGVLLAATKGRHLVTASLVRQLGTDD